MVPATAVVSTFSTLNEKAPFTFGSSTLLRTYPARNKAFCRDWPKPDSGSSAKYRDSVDGNDAYAGICNKTDTKSCATKSLAMVDATVKLVVKSARSVAGTSGDVDTQPAACKATRRHSPAEANCTPSRPRKMLNCNRL